MAMLLGEGRQVFLAATVPRLTPRTPLAQGSVRSMSFAEKCTDAIGSMHDEFAGLVGLVGIG